MKKLIIYGGVAFVSLILLVTFVGVFSAQVGKNHAARDYPPQGKLVDIGGRRIQLDCRGTGLPTVIFEAGLDINGSLSWPEYMLTSTSPLSQEVLASLKLTPEQGRQYLEIWKGLHDEESSWSSNNQHQLVPDVSHYIQFDRPYIVIEAVRSVVNDVRMHGSSIRFAFRESSVRQTILQDCNCSTENMHG
jgi:hypothetical protein